MEVERAWAKYPGWFIEQPWPIQQRLLAWAQVVWGQPPGKTKQGADFWSS